MDWIQVHQIQFLMDIHWVWPPHSNGDHQEYNIFRIGDPNLNLHLPLESWEGATPPRHTNGSLGIQQGSKYFSGPAGEFPSEAMGRIYESISDTTRWYCFAPGGRGFELIFVWSPRNGYIYIYFGGMPKPWQTWGKNHHYVRGPLWKVRKVHCYSVLAGPKGNIYIYLLHVIVNNLGMTRVFEMNFLLFVETKDPAVQL